MSKDFVNDEYQFELAEVNETTTAGVAETNRVKLESKKPFKYKKGCFDPSKKSSYFTLYESTEEGLNLIWMAKQIPPYTGTSRGK